MDSDLISPIGIFTWTIVGTVSIVAIFGNGFIIAVNGKQWLQNRKMVPSDFFLTSLSIFRLLSHLTFILAYVLEVTAGESYISTHTQEVINFTWMFSDLISLWCASWLSILYCVKVTNFANHLFLWLKPRINVLSIRLLGMSISSLMVFFSDYIGHKEMCNRTRNLSVNISQSLVFKNMFITFRLFQFIFASINFTISITASVFLIASLWKHTRNLKKSSVGVMDLTTQLHIKVIKPLLFYIFFYFLYFAGMIIYSGNPFLPLNSTELLSDILMTIFPAAHTITIVLTNPKLKTIVARILDIRKMAS